MLKTKFITVCVTSLIFAAGLTLSNCGGKSEENTEEASTESPAGTEAGKALYTSNGCATCHGDNGLGDGVAGAAITPKPRDFSATDTYKQGTSVTEITQSIAAGVPGTTMVAYTNISEEDRKKIAEYIVSIQK